MNPRVIPPPYQHQFEITFNSWAREYYGLLLEMGVGKSRILVETADRLFKEEEITGALLVSDKGCYRGFAEQIYLFGQSLAETYVWPYFPKGLGMGSLRWFLINIDALSTEKGFKACYDFCKSHKVLMIVDESTSIKNYKARRTKAAIKLGKMCPYRRISTGTPMPNGPIDLWGQMEFLKQGCLGFPSFVAFRSYYAIMKEIQMGPRRFQKIVGYRETEHLQASIKPFTSRILKKDCLDLPEKIYETIEVEQTPEQKEAYRKLKEEALMQFSGGMLTITSALTLLGKLHQINCGHVKDDAKETRRIESNRVGVLRDLTERVEGSIVIWGCFREDMVILERELRLSGGSVLYYGDTTDTEREKALDSFISGRVRFFIGNPASGGKGINGLTVAHTCIYYSNSYNLEHRLQSEDRLHRIGQRNCVTYIDLVCPGTVDVKIVKALKMKKDLSTMILDEVRGMI